MGKPKRARVHKGGRPKLSRPDIDLGTPELVSKRTALAADPVLSTCPVDLALSKGLIDQDQHSAAGYFAACRALVYGSPHPKALDLLRVSGAETIPNACGVIARTFGPYNVNAATGKVSIRSNGEEAQIVFAGSGAPTFWRLGAVRIDQQPTGRRR